MLQSGPQSVLAIGSHICSQVGTPVLLANGVVMAMSEIARTPSERNTSGESRLLLF